MWYLVLLISNLHIIFGFKLNPINKLHKTNVKMLDNDYNYDVNLLQKYKLALPKVDYNSVLQDITNHKISRLYIDTNYKQLVTVDSFNSLDVLSKDDTIFSHYHYAAIDPIVTTNLISKTRKGNGN